MRSLIPVVERHRVLAYLLWRYVPLVGKALGDCMHRVSIRRFKREVWSAGPADQSASAAYFYHYFHKDYCLSCFGRSNPNTPPVGGGDDVDPSCPTLFLYGDAGLGGHVKPLAGAAGGPGGGGLKAEEMLPSVQNV